MSGPVPTWVTAFLDLAPEDHGRAVEHWRGVTGHGLSTPRGDHGEFASFLPPDGDVHFKVQRLAAGPSKVHLDLHVPELAPAVEDAVRLGATVVATREYAALSSPGGFVFCLVTERSAVLAEPATWPGGHRSSVDQVCLDVPPARWDAEVAFWRDLTGWETRSGGAEFVSLVRPPGMAVRILLQRLDDPQPSVTGHLDLASTDRAAETQRHVELGAEVLSVHDRWTVLRPTAGPPYCITDRDPSRVTG
ncbi:VOC family protein [Nocardioides sp. W7]|uniref:VOC family protein n=1 Tax=Nocardioides sp. W7 TaxID=2931390 RepID=UPI001FD45EA5|nr:VOC family protein [Nocardioides sp. W7]